jgi:hypothetical protein
MPITSLHVGGIYHVRSMVISFVGHCQVSPMNSPSLVNSVPKPMFLGMLSSGFTAFSNRFGSCVSFLQFNPCQWCCGCSKYERERKLNGEEGG